MQLQFQPPSYPPPLEAVQHNFPNQPTSEPVTLTPTSKPQTTLKSGPRTMFRNCSCIVEVQAVGPHRKLGVANTALIIGIMLIVLHAHNADTHADNTGGM